MVMKLTSKLEINASVPLCFDPSFLKGLQLHFTCGILDTMASGGYSSPYNVHYKAELLHIWRLSETLNCLLQVK